MEAIWKFPLTLTGYHSVKMPRGAKIISFQIQRGVFCIWAIVDIGQFEEDRLFKIYGTGHEHEKIEGEYIGTVQDNMLVWHLFEVTK